MDIPLIKLNIITLRIIVTFPFIVNNFINPNKANPFNNNLNFNLNSNLYNKFPTINISLCNNKCNNNNNLLFPFKKCLLEECL